MREAAELDCPVGSPFTITLALAKSICTGPAALTLAALVEAMAAMVAEIKGSAGRRLKTEKRANCRMLRRFRSYRRKSSQG